MWSSRRSTRRLADLLPPSSVADPIRAAATRAHVGLLNVGELKVDLALDAPPVFAREAPGDPGALRLLVPDHDVGASFRSLAAGQLPDPLPGCAVPSASDPSLAPPGKAVAWVSAFVPALPADGRRWPDGNAEAADAALATVELFAPGFRSLVVDAVVTGPAEWEARTGNPHGNPNHIDLTVDQLFGSRPAAGLARYRTPIRGLFLSGGPTRRRGDRTARQEYGDGGAGRPAREAAIAPLRPAPGPGGGQLPADAEGPVTDWTAMYGQLTGYQPAAVLMAAGSTGILAALARSGGTAEEVAAATGTSVRGAEALLRGLVAIGVAVADGTSYRLTDDARALDRDGGDGLRRLIAKEAVFYRLWERLADAVRTGDALLDPFQARAAAEPSAAGAFLLALNDLAERVAPDLAVAAALEDVHRLVDLGGGGGAFADLLSRAYPQLDVTIGASRVVPITERASRSAAPIAGACTWWPETPPADRDPDGPFVRSSSRTSCTTRSRPRTVVYSAADAVGDGGCPLYDACRDGPVEPGIASST
jgi:hypothetical protein